MERGNGKGWITDPSFLWLYRASKKQFYIFNPPKDNIIYDR